VIYVEADLNRASIVREASENPRIQVSVESIFLLSVSHFSLFWWFDTLKLTTGRGKVYRPSKLGPEGECARVKKSTTDFWQNEQKTRFCSGVLTRCCQLK
jgi:hypothetical protein